MSKHTPGPWRWERRTDGEVYLVHPHAGWLVVMDFVRFGMQKGQPRFAVWNGDERANMGGIMEPAKGLDLAAHPDARLIAAAPELLAMCKEWLGFADRSFMPGDYPDSAHDRLRKLVAKAEGTS